MRKCPNCGYVDPLAWRHRGAWGAEEEVCNMDDFKVLEPELFKELETSEGKLLTTDNVYWIVKSKNASRFGGGLVVRKYRPVWEANGRRIRQKAEKPSKPYTEPKLSKFRT